MKQALVVDGKKELRFAKVAGWLALSASLLWLGWLAHGVMLASLSGKQASSAMLMGAPMNMPALVEVEEVKTDSLNPPYTYIGHVEPIQDVELRAQIEGAVAAVHFKEGATVKTGDLLFTIDPERYQARVALRTAELHQAEAALERAQSYFKRLEASDARAITQSDLDTARSDVAHGHASVQQAQANLRLAEIDLKHTQMIAPISGQIGRTVATVGDYVSPSLGPLVRIVQIDPVRVTFPVTDKDYLKVLENIEDSQIQNALRIRLMLPTGTIPDLLGTRDFADNVMSVDTATISVRARFNNKQGFLIPNGYVTVLVDLAQAPSAIVVPQQAVLTDSEGAFVYVVDQAGVAERRSIESGVSEDGRVAIKKGLQAGERVVVQGLQKVVPGQRVQIASAQSEVSHP